MMISDKRMHCSPHASPLLLMNVLQGKLQLLQKATVLVEAAQS